MTLKWNINFIRIEFDFIVFWLSEIGSWERIKNKREKIWVCWKIHRIIQIIMWKLEHATDVFCLAEGFSKLKLMPLVGGGVLRSPQSYHPCCLTPGPRHSWVASPWPLRHLGLQSLIQNNLIWFCPCIWRAAATL